MPADENNRLLAVLLLSITAALVGVYAVVRQQRQTGRICRRRCAIRNTPQSSDYFAENYPKLRKSESRFKAYTSMTTLQFDNLLEILGPHVVKTTEIPRAMRLLITLRYLVSGSSTLHSTYKIEESLCRHIISSTCEAIWTTVQPVHMQPPTIEQQLEIANNFQLKWEVPNCLGVINGRSLYNNDNFSVVLTAVVDDKYRFSHIDVRCHESGFKPDMFRSCNLSNRIINKTMTTPQPTPLPGTETPFEYFYISHEQFPLQTNIIQPYPRALIPKQTIFNDRISSLRLIFDTAVDMMTSKFNILKSNSYCLDTKFGGKVVTACLCLHNYLADCEQIQVDAEVYPKLKNRNVEDSDPNGKLARNQLADYFWTVLL